MVKWGRFAPSIVLANLVCTIAAAVERFAPPDAGLQINRASAGHRGTAIRTVPPEYPRMAYGFTRRRQVLATPAGHRFRLFRSGVYYTWFAGTRSRSFEFPSYTKRTLVASYRVWESERRSLRLYGKADNVFNQHYQNGWLAARGTVLAGLGYGFR